MSEASKGDSSGNGLAEHAVRELKAKTRGLRLQVEELHDVSLQPTDSIVVWLVLFASMIINIGRRGQDGRSAWELRYGRNCGRQMAEFSEQILWRDGNNKSRLEDRWHKG
eukprot:4363775-Amphidinium_carterae.1